MGWNERELLWGSPAGQHTRLRLWSSSQSLVAVIFDKKSLGFTLRLYNATQLLLEVKATWFVSSGIHRPGLCAWHEYLTLPWDVINPQWGCWVVVMLPLSAMMLNCSVKHQGFILWKRKRTEKINNTFNKNHLLKQYIDTHCINTHNQQLIHNPLTYSPLFNY